eukprot:COSAG01_NODE_55295_length_326_cov_0.682819_1_plen_51_part_10
MLLAKASRTDAEQAQINEWVEALHGAAHIRMRVKRMELIEIRTDWDLPTVP